jgi:hypothetical protein
VDELVPSRLADFEGESALDSCLQLPTFPKRVGGDIGQELVEPFRPSGLGRAVDSAADDIEDLPPIPDTPSGYARFGFISRESFNTAVQDLVQQSPDTPIGGDGAALMKRSFNVGMLATNGSSTYLDTPQFEISSPPNVLEYDGEKKALRTRSNFSDPFQESYEPEARIHTGPSSPPMFTAPQSPKADRANIRTSFSLDGPGRGGMEIRDFAQQPDFPQVSDVPPLPDCCISPRSQVSDGYIFASSNPDARVAKENLRGVPISVVSPAPVQMDQAMSTVPPNAQGVSVIVEEVGSSGLDATTLLQAPVVSDEVKTQGPKAPNVNLPQVAPVGILTDATGKLQPPGTPPRRVPKRKRLIRLGQKVFRNGRRVILRKPVLTVVIGRQLAGPTSQALKLISKGEPLDLSDLPKAPVPAPGIPA